LIASTRSRTRFTTSSWIDSCTNMRVGRPQPWPANAPTERAVVNAQAVWTSASSSTMFADLPPSSRTTGFAVSAHAVRIFVAVASPPVKLTFRTSGWVTSRCPASAVPGSRFTTPGGKPAASTRSMNSSPLNGVSSLGLITTVFPAASAAGTFMAMDISGAFQVMIIAITPYGCGSV
jgi:hypothetical protein